MVLVVLNLNLLEEMIDIVCYYMNINYFKIGDFFDWYIVNFVFCLILVIVIVMVNWCIFIIIWRIFYLYIFLNVIFFFLVLFDFGVGLLV